MNRLHYIAATALLAPLLTGAEGGCGALNSRSDAPNAAGEWALSYDDTLAVTIKIGGAVHTAEVGTEGGAVTIDHEGKPITFDLDCAREEIVCPSEVWPEQVRITHRNPKFPHRMFIGWETGESKEWRDHFALINEAGDHFQMLLGAGVASNGVNCALLGLSAAEVDLVTTGDPEEGTWSATAMENGEVAVGYAGGCLWAGDPDGDGELEAVVLGASIEMRTGFSGSRM